jgi:dienelactone hydrolase
MSTEGRGMHGSTAGDTRQAALTEIPGGSRAAIPTYVATPATPAPWPGVVVVHDALGMTEDLRNQTRWLADAGYLAAAPDLFHDGRRLWCLVQIMRDMSRAERTVRRSPITVGSANRRVRRAASSSHANVRRGLANANTSNT